MQTENLLKDVLSADNQVRQRAETEFESKRQADPAALIQLFLGNINNTDEAVAQMACVLFKKYFLDRADAKQLPAADLEQMRAAIVSSLNFDQKFMTLKRKAEIVSKIYFLQDQSEALLQLIGSSGWAAAEATPVQRQFALYLFEKQSECHLTPAQIRTHSDSFMTVLQGSLLASESTTMEVRLSALRATAAFVHSAADDAGILTKFKTLLPSMIEVVVAALQQDEDLGKNALESFVDLSQAVPEFFKEAAATVVKIVSDAARNDEFDESTKSQACEIVLNMTEKMPAVLRKVNEVKTDFWPALMQLLARCEVDMEAWEASLDDEMGTKSDAYSTAVSSIGRISAQLKEKHTVAASTGFIGECVNHEDWTAKQAGFIALGLIVESTKDHLKANMDAAMQQVCTGLQEDHVRVKYARLFALGQLLQHLAPNVQFKYHGELMPALLGIVTNEQSLKVKTQAFSCLEHFMQGLIREDELEIETTKKSADIVADYNESLFKALIDNLKQSVDAGYEPLQEQVLNLLNVSASLIETQFAAYFDGFMPLMVKILTGVAAETPAQRNLRARCIESMGTMIAAVAEEQRFKPTVQEVTEKLFSMLTSGNFDASDPQELAIKDTIAKIAFYLGEDFHHVAPAYLDILLKDAALEAKIDFQQLTQGENSASTAPQQTAFNFKVFGMENQTQLNCNVYELETKIAAFGHLLKVSQAMGTHFAVYVEKVLPILYKHFGYLARQVRKNAMKTLQFCLIAREGEPALLHAMFDQFAFAILKANKKQDTKELKLVYKELYKCLDAAKEAGQTQLFASEAKMNQFFQVVQQSLKVVYEVKMEKSAAIQEQHEAGQVDEEDIDGLQTQLYKTAGAATYIGEALDVIMGTYKKAVTQLVETNALPYFKQVIQTHAEVSEVEQQSALYFFIQFIIECKQADDQLFVYEMCSYFIEIAMASEPDDTDVRQNAVYGLGIFAKYLAPQQFASLQEKGFGVIEKLLSDPEAQEEDKLGVTENCHIAVGLIAFYQTKNPAHVATFLSKLPLTRDEEAKEGHEILFDQVLAGNPALQGQESAVKEALERINAAKTEDNMTEELAAKMNQVIAKLQG